MAISLDFRAYQKIGQPSDIFIEDLSTGSDGSVIERHLFLQKEDGTYLTPTGSTTDYIVWPLNIGTLSILNILDKDYALSITVELEGLSSPIPTTGLWAWYDAGLGVTGTTTVTSWADQSGNSRDLTSLSGKEPELITGAINSLPVVRTSTIVAAMKTAGVFPDTSHDVVLFVVCKQKVGAGALDDTDGTFFSTGANSLYLSRTFNGTNDNIYSQFKLNDLLTPITNNTFYSLRVRWASGAGTLAVNNTLQDSASGTLLDLGATELYLFSKNGAADFGNKEIAEVIVYNSTLTDLQVTQIETYLQTKYALY